MLKEFTFIPYQRYDSILHHLRQSTNQPELGITDTLAALDDDLAAAEAAQSFRYLNNQDKPINDQSAAEAIAFKTSFCTIGGDELWVKCQRNQRSGAQPWYGLWFILLRQDVRIRDIYFSNWEEMLGFLDSVATMAIEEKWTYQEYRSKVNHPILKSYIENTYDRLVQQGRVVHLDSGQTVFNSGLINKWFREIYIICDRDASNPRRLNNPKAYLASDRQVMSLFSRGDRRPELATFFADMSEVVFDPDLPVYPDDEHIIEDNLARVPERYRNHGVKSIYALTQSAIEAAKIMAKRNYKLIVPQFHHGQIQFLMPIYLSLEFSGAPDFALVLEKMGDSYRGNTILTLDMAYQNARLIAKPEAIWLNPDFCYNPTVPHPDDEAADVGVVDENLPL